MRLPTRLLLALLMAAAVVAVQPAKAADDPLSNLQWAITQVHAPTAWSVSTGKDIKIGIVDSGVNRNHEDLAGKVLASATCVDTGGDVAKCADGGNDINGHGTHVAGIAAAHTGNGLGVASVAPDAKLIVARVFKPGQPTPQDPEPEPDAEVEDVAAGIEWVVSQGAQIVNLSLGLGGVCVTCGADLGGLAPAIEKAWKAGALPVMASGNRSGSILAPTPDFGDINAIIVAGTDRTGEVSGLSLTTGSARWGIAAPGGGVASDTDPRCTDPSRTDCPMVLSSYAGGEQCGEAPNCYAYQAGSSMAAPHVSGAAALLLAKGLSRDQTIDTLLATTDTIECGESCSGRLNVARALSTVASDDTNEPKKNGNGNSPATTSKPSVSGSSTRSNVTATTPTTSPFTFGNETASGDTTSRRPRGQAIVLNTEPPNDSGVPVSVGFVGIVALAGATLALSYSLRRTLTTLP